MARDALVGLGGMPLSADILRRLLESSQDVLYAVALDPVHMLYATPAFARRMGLPEDFLNRGYAFSEYLTSVHPDDLDRVARIMRAIVDSRTDADLPENPASYRLRTPDGGWRIINDFYSVLRHADGVAHTLIGNARDVSEQSEARQALAENEARFRVLAENSRDLFFSMRFPEGSFEYLSPSYGEVTGYSPEEHYADPGIMFRVIAPEWRGQVARWLEDIRRGEVRESYDYQILDRFGRLRWLNQRQVLVPAPDGRGMLLQGVATDITDLRETQQALAESEARFRSLAESSRDIFFSFRLPEGRYEFVNSRVTELHGLSPQDFYDDPGVFMRCLAPAWRETAKVWLAEIAQGTVRDTYEFEVLDRHGRLRWIVQRVVLVPAPDGRGQLLHGVASDQTEERKSREALRQSEERYRHLVESWTDHVVMRINLATGRPEYVSPSVERLFGHTPEAVCSGGPPHQIVAPEWRESIKAWLEENRRGELRPEYQCEILDAGGNRRWVSARGALVNDGQGRPAAVQIVFFDITERRRLGEELKSSRAFMDCVIEQSPMSMWISDDTGTLIRSNQALRKLFQVSEEEVVGRYNIFNDGQLEERGFMPEIRRVFEQGGTVRLMLPYDTARIEELSLERTSAAFLDATISAVQDAQGKTTNLIVQHLDISEHKRTEEALRESNERYTLLAENLVDVIWTTDANLRWTYLSPSAERLSGISMARLMGMRFEELFTPESMGRIGELMARRRVAPTPAEQDEPYRVEMDLRHADGSLVPLEVLVRPMRGPGGEISGYCGTSRDITQRRRTEEALRKSEERYALALKGANDGIWDWDLVEDEMYFSDRWKEIIGYAPDELRHDASEWTARIHPEDLDRVMAANARCLRGEGPVFQLEYRLRHKDGSYRWIFGRGAALADASGQVLRMAGAHTDITARKQTEEALLRSERFLRKLLESMHEGVWAVDADRRTTFVNERLCAMLGYSSAELMNMAPPDVLEWPQRALAEARFGERADGHSGATDYVLVRKDGSRFPAHVVSSPIMEEQGRFEGLVSGVVDLTERARMEHELRRNQARFEALYELSRLIPATEHQLAAYALHEAIRLTDSEAGVLFFVSADGQTLVPKAWESCGELSAGLAPSFPSSGPLPWALVLQSGQPLVLNDFSECAGLIPEGHPAVARLLGVPALDGQRPVAVLGLTGKAEPYTAEDTLQTTLLLDGMWRVVRARRDEERIRASLKEKDALLHEVHHRVKNNLQVISSLLDMAGRRLSTSEARLSLSEVRGKVQAMSLIHAQLHSIGSAGGISLERFVRALFQQLREVYAGGLDLSLRLGLGELVLSLDQAVPLGLALNETLTNVFKHACPPAQEGEGRASRVEIRAERDPSGRVSIEIRDDGPGLPAGFEPDRADSLGMKLMKGLVRHQLRGELKITDAAPGVCVRIRFLPHVAK
ncbi:MAG: PAS domain S-box protein [Humidesulfovibrio sp.]